MARPSSPLIIREETVRVALQIIDDEGIDALSLPRLARELNVRAPSLYHHFADKDEILAAVCQVIVTKTVLSVAMLVDHLGHTDDATRIEFAGSKDLANRCGER